VEQHSREGDAEGRDLVRHEEPGFGYAVTVPADLAAVMNTVDPLARLLRGVHARWPELTQILASFELIPPRPQPAPGA